MSKNYRPLAAAKMCQAKSESERKALVSKLIGPKPGVEKLFLELGAALSIQTLRNTRKALQALDGKDPEEYLLEIAESLKPERKGYLGTLLRGTKEEIVSQLSPAQRGLLLSNATLKEISDKIPVAQKDLSPVRREVWDDLEFKVNSIGYGERLDQLYEDIGKRMSSKPREEQVAIANVFLDDQVPLPLKMSLVGMEAHRLSYELDAAIRLRCYAVTAPYTAPRKNILFKALSIVEPEDFVEAIKHLDSRASRRKLMLQVGEISPNSFDVVMRSWRKDTEFTNFFLQEVGVR